SAAWFHGASFRNLIFNSRAIYRRATICSQRVGEGPSDLIAAFGSSYKNRCSAKICGTEFIREGFRPDTLQSLSTQSASQFAARQRSVEDVADPPAEPVMGEVV
ncbi:hypothetical protein QN386_21570, partial [Pseudomonas sp. CCI3.2]|uniref:hypothetical protein n=1 Tax=Pseudomonas sp. CCI3.2 TaxID=3048619 RepID=UPI002B22EC33